MTVIAWDGITLAADRRSVSVGTIGETTKIHRVRGCLVGTSGESCIGEEILAWFGASENPEEFPEACRTEEGWGRMLVIREDGRVQTYERSPYPLRQESKYFAIGSGADIALAAMHLGEPAADAVLLASKLNAGCGNGVDTLVLKGLDALLGDGEGVPIAEARAELAREGYLGKVDIGEGLTSQEVQDTLAQPVGKVADATAPADGMKSAISALSRHLLPLREGYIGKVDAGATIKMTALDLQATPEKVWAASTAKTREEVARFIEQQFSEGGCSREKDGSRHYGYQEAHELMDFIYGEPPQTPEQNVTIPAQSRRAWGR